MPRITPDKAGSRNLCAFLDMLAYAEIGTRMLNDSDDGYNVLVGSLPGKMTLFDSYADHPRQVVQVSDNLRSSAAGRYQILSRYWDHYKAQIGLPDFGPLSQDRYAIQQIREQRALDDVHAGRFAKAVAKVANIWASMPGAGYGQHERKLGDLRQAYLDAGGRLEGDAEVPEDDSDNPDQLDRIEEKVDQLIALQLRDGGV